MLKGLHNNRQRICVLTYSAWQHVWSASRCHYAMSSDSMYYRKDGKCVICPAITGVTELIMRIGEMSVCTLPHLLNHRCAVPLSSKRLVCSSDNKKHWSNSVVAQSWIRVDLNCPVNLGAVQLLCQKSAAVVSQWLEDVYGAQHKRMHELCVHGEGLNPYAVYTISRLQCSSWTVFKSQDALTLLSKCLSVVAMTVMTPSVQRREVKQPSSFSDLEKLHRETKADLSWKKNISLGRRGDTESCTHCLRTHINIWWLLCIMMQLRFTSTCYFLI